MTREDAVICENCNRHINIEESIVWPGENGIICQECWEEECDKAWWEMVQMLPNSEQEAK